MAKAPGKKSGGGSKSGGEVTGEKAGKAASKVMKSGSTGKDSKTAAASALTQRPPKKK
jgi:hypothetical protein